MIGEQEFRARVDAERGVGTIRSRVGPWLLPCCWTECDRPARREHPFAVRNEAQDAVLFYFFCSGRHRVMWKNSPHAMGNMPMGAKGMVS